MEQSLWEADSSSASHEIPAIYGIRRFTAVLTTAHHWSLSWDRIQTTLPSYPFQYYPPITNNNAAMHSLGLGKNDSNQWNTLQHVHESSGRWTYSLIMQDAGSWGLSVWRVRACVGTNYGNQHVLWSWTAGSKPVLGTDVLPLLCVVLSCCRGFVISRSPSTNYYHMWRVHCF